MQINKVNNYNLFSVKINNTSQDLINETLTTIDTITQNKDKSVIILQKDNQTILICQLNTKTPFTFREVSFNEKFDFVAKKHGIDISITKLNLKLVKEHLLLLLSEQWIIHSFPKLIMLVN